MAVNFDNLLSFLLQKIALCGEQGGTTSDFRKYVAEHYNLPTPSADSQVVEPALDLSLLLHTVNPLIDHPLLDAIWKWLAAHPDVSIGKDKEGNKFSLARVEKLPEIITSEPPPSDEIRQCADRSRTIARSGEIGPFTTEGFLLTRQDPGANGIVASRATASLPVEVDSSSCLLRIFVDEKRMWHAVAGHSRDLTKISHLEFQLLSLIAKCGEGGVLQPELTRLSGQDKRSVPKRTDKLHKLGYIAKRPVIFKGMSTSLCTHRNFLLANSEKEQEKCAGTDSVSVEGQEVVKDGVILFDNLIDVALQLLQSYGVITQGDFRRKMGFEGRRWESRTLFRYIRRLEILGCVRRTMAKDKGSGKVFKCVKFIRMPTKKDLQLAKMLLQNQLNAKRDDMLEADAEGDEDLDMAAATVEREDDVDFEELRRLPPQWTPDQPLYNLLFDIIEGAGRKGISTMDLASQGLGSFCDRPLYSSLGYLTDFWQLSQPAHLRHFSIIRDTDMIDKVAHYQYRTYDNFDAAVKAGEATWEAVDTSSKANYGKDAQPRTGSSSDDIDGWGFPKISTNRFLGRGGIASVAECCNSVSDRSKRSSLARIRTASDTSVFGAHANQQHELGAVVSPPFSTRKRKSGQVPTIARGRPRKYVKGAEPDNRLKLTAPIREALRADERSLEVCQHAESMTCAEVDGSQKRTADQAGFDQVSEQEDVGQVDLAQAELEAAAAQDPDLASDAGWMRRQGHSASTGVAAGSVKSLFNRQRLALGLPSKRGRPSEKDRVEVAKLVQESGIHLEQFEKQTESLQPYDNDVLNAGETYSYRSTDPSDLLRTPPSYDKTSARKRVKSRISREDEQHETSIHPPAEQVHKLRTEFSLKPGVYVNPPHARRITAGRPKKYTLMLVFKLPALKDLDWFNPEFSTSKEAVDADHQLLEISGQQSATAFQNDASSCTRTQESESCTMSMPLPAFARAELAVFLDSSIQEARPTRSQRAVEGEAPSSQPPQFDESYDTAKTPGVSSGLGTTYTGRSKECSVPRTYEAPYGSSNAVFDTMYDTRGPKARTPILSGVENFRDVPTHPSQESNSATGGKKLPHKLTTLQPQLEGRDFPASNAVNAESRQAKPLISSSATPQVPSATLAAYEWSQLPSATVTLEENHGKVSPVVVQLSRLRRAEGENIVHGPILVSSGESSATAQTKLQKSSTPRKSGVDLGGGHLGHQRSKIIMDVLTACGGAFPGGNEIWYPFITAWGKLYENQRPDRTTVARAVNNLISTGKLRKASFAFKSNKGEVLTKSVIFVAGASPEIEIIQKTQNEMINKYPGLYIPREVEVSEELSLHDPKRVEERQLVWRESLSNPEMLTETVERQYQSPTDIVIQQRKEETRVRREAKLQEQGNRRTRETLKGRQRPAYNARQPRDVQSNYRASQYSHNPQPLPRPIQTGRGIKRLHSLKGPTQRTPFAQRPLPPAPNRPIGAVLDASDFPTDAAGALQSFEPINAELDFDWRLDGGLEDDFIFPGQNLFRAFTDFGNDDVLATKQDPRGLGLHSLGQPFCNTSVDREPPSHRSKAAVFSDTERSADDNGRSRFEWRFINEGPATYDPGFDIVHVGTLLDPDQTFYPNSGTFSTDYLVIRNARTTLWRDPHVQYEKFTPTCLEDILDKTKLPLGTSQGRGRYSPHDIFDWEVNQVLAWEKSLRGHCFFVRRLGQPHFICHTILTNSHNSSLLKMTPVLWDHPASRIYTLRHPPRSRGLPTLRTKLTNSKPGRKAVNNKDAISRNVTTSSALSGIAQTPTQRRKDRGKLTKQIGTKETLQKFITAVVVTRTLTGGLRRSINWDVILKMGLFDEDYGVRFLRSRWGSLYTRQRMEIERMTAEFQEAFIKAYEEGAVPNIDFNSPQDYDWETLIGWTMKNMEIPDADLLPELPVTRQELDKYCLVKVASEFTDPATVKEELIVSGTSVDRREEILTNLSFTVPIPQSTAFARHNQTKAEEERLAIAKTWIRANIATAEEIYDSRAARDKLLPLGTHLIDRALSSLLSAKVLRQENKGRLIPGRNYDITDSFLNSFRKPLEPAHFVTAAAYKRELDNSFAEQGYAMLSYHVQDGECLALWNLIAAGRVKIGPVLEPERFDKWGFVEGRYKMNKMDRSRLNFGVGIWPTETWVSGNPFDEMDIPLPPAPHLGIDADEDGLSGQGGTMVDGETKDQKIPLWYDIHGNLIPTAWNMAAAAVLSCIALRAGIGAEDIAKSVKRNVGVWEVELVLRFMERVGAAKRTSRNGGGWTTGEWWWLILGEA